MVTIVVLSLIVISSRQPNMHNVIGYDPFINASITCRTTLVVSFFQVLNVVAVVRFEVNKLLLFY